MPPLTRRGFLAAMAVPLLQDHDALVGARLKRFNSVAALINGAEEIIVFEGLPHEFLREEFAREVATKQTMRLNGYAFYTARCPSWLRTWRHYALPRQTRLTLALLR